MSNSVISVENLSKSYRLGQIGTGTLTNDLKLWWARARGKPNPLLKIGQTDHGKQVGETLWALKDVSFQVEQGEVLGIIGRNGAGKSTLLKILSRVTAPTSGVVKVKGRIASLLEVGTGFHPELTGRENIYLNGAILGMTKEEVKRKFDEIVDFAEIAQFIDTPVKRYSSGMYVRLAFAVAAHLESEILLVDEVLAVGDAEFQKKCLGKMGDVSSKEGRTVLFVSHNMNAITSLCGRCIMLKSGMVEMDGKTDNVVACYLQARDTHNVAIADRMDREGNGPVRVIDCAISNSPSAAPATDFFIGDDVYINLTLQAYEPTKIWIAVFLNDTFGNRVFASSNRTQGLRPFMVQNQKEISLYLPRCRLGEGIYYIDLAVHISHPLNLSDSIKSVKSFHIIPKDIYQSGFPITSYYGNVHLQNEWLTNET